MTAGEKIKARRTALGMTQQALGAKVGISQSMVQKMEASNVFPSRQVSDALCAALDLPLDEFWAKVTVEKEDYCRSTRKRVVIKSAVTGTILGGPAGLLGGMIAGAIIAHKRTKNITVEQVEAIGETVLPIVSAVLDNSYANSAISIIVENINNEQFVNELVSFLDGSNTNKTG